MMEIETGIPVPNRTKTVIGLLKTMEVGQSFVAKATTIRTSVSRVQNASDKRFTTSSDDLERGLVRVWRTT